MMDAPKKRSWSSMVPADPNVSRQMARFLAPGDGNRRVRTSVEKSEVVEFLRQRGKGLPADIGALFNLKETTYYRFEGNGVTSFSTQQDLGVEGLAMGLVDNAIQAGDAPHFAPFGIAITSRGSNSYCTLVDSERRIIVWEHLGNIASDGSWRRFVSKVDETIAMVRQLDGKKQFTYVVNDLSSAMKEVSW